MKQSDNIEKIRHSLAHVLAMAVLEKFPKAKLGIGPTIENGFYYDFDFAYTDKDGLKQISTDDLLKIEKRIKELIKQDLKFEKEELNYPQAKKLFKDQPYKLELIEELKKTKKPIIIYKTLNNNLRKSVVNLYESAFTDLCAGPHIDSTKEINSDGFKLTKVAGAYWRGSEKNPMLTRIYGIAFNSKKELEDYLKILEEAEKRDHRKLGKDLNLFSFHDEGPGFPFWHAKGMIIYSQLENFIRKENEKRGYQEIKTPPILNKKLWLASGHWDKFREAMYFTKIDEQEFAVKPMNCPGGMLVFKEKIHSYKDLPLRYSEFGLVHRHELSGVLHGLFRARSFTQDDAHSYCTPDQLNNEIVQMVDYALDIYKTFGFNEYEIFIATRPE
ncbi:threonine--tRNA ligase, partial [Patescibacteria group bacterium]|nr:threonine--tRNA ligase [Patescibacteria group bacterium]